MELTLKKSKQYGYLGNDEVLRHGVRYPYTEAEIREYLKCKSDPIYFIKKWCKVVHIDHGLVNFNLYPYQEKMIDQFTNNRFNIVLACRQSGKCLEKSTVINIRNKKTNKIEQITIEEFHERFKQNKTDTRKNNKRKQQEK